MFAEFIWLQANLSLLFRFSFLICLHVWEDSLNCRKCGFMAVNGQDLITFWLSLLNALYYVLPSLSSLFPFLLILFLFCLCKYIFYPVAWLIIKETQSRALYVLPAEFDKLLNVQKGNQLCSCWILVLKCGSSKPAKKTHQQSMLLWNIVWYGTTVPTSDWITILTVLTAGMGLNGVTSPREPSSIVHLL